MADLDVTMGPKEDLAPPTSDDKRIIDNIKNTKAPEPEAEFKEEKVFKNKEEEGEDGLEVKPIIKDEVVFGDEDEPPSPPVKKKKQATEKQRAHLKKAREKALATRQAKAKLRKQGEAEKKAERQKKREEKEQLELEKEEKEYKSSKIESVPTKSSLRSLTEEQILVLQENAIANYETKRKKAKEEKKKVQAKVDQDKKIYESINKAVNPDPDDVWQSCFQ